MTQSREHRECVQNMINHIKNSHNSYKEYPFPRNGNFYFLDSLSVPHQDKEHLFKSLALQCEIGSNQYNKESNQLLLQEVKKHFPENTIEIAQIRNVNEFDFDRLKKCSNEVNGVCVEEKQSSSTIPAAEKSKEKPVKRMAKIRLRW